MKIMIYTIGLLNIMSIYEIVKSDIWHSKRRSIDCIKSIFMTIALSSILVLFVCYTMLSIRDNSSINGAVGILVTSAALIQSVATHQFAYVINRRKIIGNRRNKNVGKRAC